MPCCLTCYSASHDCREGILWPRTKHTHTNKSCLCNWAMTDGGGHSLSHHTVYPVACTNWPKTCFGLLSTLPFTAEIHSWFINTAAYVVTSLKVQSVWTQFVLRLHFVCALSVNEAGECGGVGGCQLQWRVGRTACFGQNTFLASRFYTCSTAAVNVSDRSFHLCHNISDAVFNPNQLFGVM